MLVWTSVDLTGSELSPLVCCFEWTRCEFSGTFIADYLWLEWRKTLLVRAVKQILLGGLLLGWFSFRLVSFRLASFGFEWLRWVGWLVLVSFGFDWFGWFGWLVWLVVWFSLVSLGLFWFSWFGWLVDWFGWFFGWLVWLVGSSVGWLVCLVVCRLSYPVRPTF